MVCLYSTKYKLFTFVYLCYLAGPAATTSGVKIIMTKKHKYLQRCKNEDMVPV